MPEGTTALHSTRYWGRTSYKDAWHRQSELVTRRLSGGIGDTLVLTEHDPVFTHGQRAGALANLVWDAPRLEREGIAVLPTNRGGDITYHGPGQIVGYPIVCLEVRRDLHAYLRFLEDVLLATLGDWGLAGNRREGQDGDLARRTQDRRDRRRRATVGHLPWLCLKRRCQPRSLCRHRALRDN